MAAVKAEDLTDAWQCRELHRNLELLALFGPRINSAADGLGVEGKGKRRIKGILRVIHLRNWMDCGAFMLPQREVRGLGRGVDFHLACVKSERPVRHQVESPAFTGELWAGDVDSGVIGITMVSEPMGNSYFLVTPRNSL